jgi:uncharacterized protein (DUF342 family)
LIDTLQSLEVSMDAIKQEYKKHSDDLYALIENDIKEQLSDKDYGCGTATVNVDDNLVLKAVVSKKIKYDQKGLKEVVERIKSAGKNPDEYVKTKYDVSETAYKNWPSDIKQVFEPHRTVEASPAKISWEVK